MENGVKTKPTVTESIIWMHVVSITMVRPVLKY